MNELDVPQGRELDALRDWDTGADPLDDGPRRRARARLFAAMDPAAGQHGRPARPPRRRPLVRTAVSCAVAAAVAATVLVTLDDGEDAGQRAAPPAGPGSAAPSGPAMRNVSARTVLTKAAAYERDHEKTVVPRDDQFIYTKEIIKETNQATGETKRYTDENWASVDNSKRSWVMEIGHGWWSPPAADKENETVWPPNKWSTLKALPTDPEELILTLANFGSAPPPGQKLDDLSDATWDDVHFSLAGLLKLVPVMPAGLRPAAYEALGMVPGVKAVPGQKDAKGRVGVAITYDAPNSDFGGFGSWFIFDPKTYAFLGSRDERTSGDGKEKQTYTQLSYLDSWAVTDHAKQRP